jgi:hypothetical protein
MCAPFVPLQVATVSAVSEEMTGPSSSRLWLGNLVGSYVSYIELGDAAAASARGSQEASSHVAGMTDEL